MYKKVICLVLIVSMIMSFSIPSYASSVERTENFATKSNVKYGAFVKGVGRNSSKLKNNTLDEGENAINMSQMKFTADEKGNLVFNGSINGLDFNIIAESKGISKSGNIHVYEGIDKLDNFEVFYVSHEKEIDKSAMYFDNLRNKYKEVIKVYMKPELSEDFAIIEIFNPEVKFPKIRSKASINGKNDINMFWYAKAFDPMEEYDEINNDTKRNSIVPNETDYKYCFSHLGLNIKQHFIIERAIDYPNSFNNEGTFTTRIMVVDEYTECTNASNQNSDDTYIRIDSARIDIAIDEGDACSGYEIDGKVHKNSSVDLTFGFNKNINLLGVVSVDLSYDNYDNDNDLNTTVRHLPNTIGNYYRQVGIDLDDNRRLEDEGHYLSVKWDVTNYDNSYKTRDFDVKFTYDMVNLVDYTHWINGEKTLSDSVSYRSY